MKKYIVLALATLSLASCNDWLKDETPGITRLQDYFMDGTEDKAEEVATAAYVPLMWEFGEGDYCYEWMIGDVASDDALKGGQNIADGLQYGDIDNFKVQADNSMLLSYWRAQWTGVARANLAITQLPTMANDSIREEFLDRTIGEAEFLRAYYYFRLVRVFGGMPIITDVIDSDTKWAQVRNTTDECYDFIIKDLESAESKLWLKSEYDEEDLGRATKGAAQAMLAKVNLYRKNYAEAKKWAKKVIDSGEYSLFADYFDNFTLEGENGSESVFEIQYMDDDMSDGWNGFGFTRGSLSQVMTRSRSSVLGGGWGYNRPTHNLYNEYETEPTLDPRRDMTILSPKDNEITNEAEENYCGTWFVSNKLAWTDWKTRTFPRLSHDTRGPLNNRQIRYADVLLMYAEACCELGDLAEAKSALNQVRERVGLADFPYTATIQGKSTQFKDNQDDLRTAIRHERRVELAMEGHRWFDLVRWGIAKKTMDAYIAGETNEAKQLWGQFVEGKNELFPIPTLERQLSGIDQNPGY